jgi:hypothetical protein
MNTNNLFNNLLNIVYYVEYNQDPNDSNEINNILNTFIQNTLGTYMESSMEDVKIRLKESEIENIETYFWEPNKKRKLDDDSEDQNLCSICRADFIDGEIIRKLNCSHLFHSSCILKWLRTKSNKCPMCREELGEGEPIIDDKINVI